MLAVGGDGGVGVESMAPAGARRGGLAKGGARGGGGDFRGRDRLEA
jgi:hypothetical protein